MNHLTCHISCAIAGTGRGRHNTDVKFRQCCLGYAETGLYILENKPLPEEFNEIFKPAVEEYNARMIESGHPGRSKSLDYYSHIKKSEKVVIAREIVVTLGNYYSLGIDCGNEEARIEAARMLNEWYQEFVKNNPELHVYCAAIHCDEKGAPHLHVDFFAAAMGVKQGVSLSPSFDRALKNMGFGEGKIFSKAFVEWIEHERVSMEKIIREHGYAVTRGSGMTRAETLCVEEYKRLADESEQISYAFRTRLMGEITPYIVENGKKVGNPKFVDEVLEVLGELMHKMNMDEQIRGLLEQYECREKERKKTWKQLYVFEESLKEEIKQLELESNSHDYLQPARNAQIMHKNELMLDIKKLREDHTIEGDFVTNLLEQKNSKEDFQSKIMNLLRETYPMAYEEAKSLLEAIEPKAEPLVFEMQDKRITIAEEIEEMDIVEPRDFQEFDECCEDLEDPEEEIDIEEDEYEEYL